MHVVIFWGVAAVRITPEVCVYARLAGVGGCAWARYGTGVKTRQIAPSAVSYFTLLPLYDVMANPHNSNGLRPCIAMTCNAHPTH
jgi:hypothetical protein